MNYIYCYTNVIENKSYVGQTNNLERRKREHLHDAYAKNDKKTLFHQKIQEYGIDSFTFEVLEEISNGEKSFVDAREIYWIKVKHSFMEDNEYNMTKGGSTIEKEKSFPWKKSLK